MRADREQRRRRSRWEVQRERCRIVDREPPAAKRPARSIGEIIPGVIAKLDTDEHARFEGISEDWARVVGTAVAAHTRPGGIEHGVLTVYVDSSVWLSELARFGCDTILRKLAECPGDVAINEVRFRIDPGRPPSRAAHGCAGA